MEENNKRKRIIILSICVLTMVLVGILGTYAFFVAGANNDNNQKAELTSGTVSLTFADGNNTINESLMLSETVTKTFTLENTGSIDATVSMEWLDLINTYIDRSLTYTLEYSETEGGTYTKIVTDEKVPTTSTAFTTTLAPDITIPKGKKYYYNLVITFNNLTDVNQESDKNATLSTKFKVSEASTNRSYNLVIDPNGGTLNGETGVQTKTLKAGVTESIGTPTNGSKTFKGWKISGYGSTLNSGTLILGKSNTKLVAEWETGTSEETLKKLGLTSKGVLTNFDAPATTDEGVYEMEDDYGTSYYYRGAVTNNYVKFGKNKDNQDMYWRIIRINGDGSIRIIYDGDQAYPNGTNSAKRFTHKNQKWNTLYDDAKYVGWMYGPADATEGTTTPSPDKVTAQTNTESVELKTLVDTWYKENIGNTEYASAVSDTLFCNDRSTPGKSVTEWTKDTGLGYAENITGYGALGRFLTGNNSTNLGAKGNIQPIFTCPQKNDAFTVSDTEKGNGVLQYPVGLITADEIVAAGGKYGDANDAYYLYNPNTWSLSFSPYYMDTGGGAYVFNVSTNGSLINSSVYIGGAVAPVINLSAEYIKNLEGTGKINDPFRATGVRP